MLTKSTSIAMELKRLIQHFRIFFVSFYQSLQPNPCPNSNPQFSYCLVALMALSRSLQQFCRRQRYRRRKLESIWASYRSGQEDRSPLSLRGIGKLLN